MVEEERESLNVKIKRSLSRRFRELVNKKHPEYKRGGLTFEVETALAQYIATYSMQQQSTQNSLQASIANPGFKAFQLKDNIYKYLVESGQYLDVPQFISESQLIQAVSTIKGLDYRTQKKWIRLLQQFGCLKRSGLHQFEFV